jgi:TRAP transporter TAXI family solute receptor
MKRYAIRVAWLVGVFLLSSWTWVNAEGNDVLLGLIAGDSKSTVYRIGEDIRDLVTAYGIDLNVYPSHGDVENIVAVYQRPGNHLGLVASDVLAFVAKVDTDPRLKLIANKIKWLFPLYDQDVHVLGNAQIQTFSDLANRRIAVGNEQSGTYLTSRLLFELSGVKPLELIAMDNGQALAALRDGRIDAMIDVDGFPVDWLTLWVSSVDGLHLVPITAEHIRAFYPASRIPAGTYPWQATDVETVSVKTVLVAYDFRNQYCNAIGRLAWLIRENLDWLRQHGHPKWKTVNFNESVKGWEPYECAIDYMPRPHEGHNVRSPDTDANPVVDAIQAIFQP